MIEELNERQVKVVRVALPKNLRASNKSFPGLKFYIVGKTVIENKLKIGDQGIMTVTDYEAKNYGPYGLKEYFDGAGKVQMIGAVVKENSELQNIVMDKDAEIEKLKAELAMAKTQNGDSNDFDLSSLTIPKLRDLAEEKGINVKNLTAKADIINALK